MRLLNTSTLTFEEFFGAIPSYAILSHTWGDGEVLFNDIQNDTACSKKGFAKIENCCRLAASEDYQYVWIDTCCIDKSSSAELSEVINSMFAYYRDSSVCYVYLDIDIPSDRLTTEGLQEARWTFRGWTLLELIAPKYVRFYDKNWTPRGTRGDNQVILVHVTGIPSSVLGAHREQEQGESQLDFSTFSIADRMSWASKRQTTRPEDLAYSLFGIFGVNLPVLYSEGAAKAFLRLQEEIIKTSLDLSILAWSADHMSLSLPRCSKTGVLAASPACFTGDRSILVLENAVESFKMTNKGLRVKLPIIMNEAEATCILLLLNCRFANKMDAHVGIPLFTENISLFQGGTSVWYRILPSRPDKFLHYITEVDEKTMRTAQVRKIYIGART